MEAVNTDRESTVLDVACGLGYVALGFAAACREVIGIDLTPEMLRELPGVRAFQLPVSVG